MGPDRAAERAEAARLLALFERRGAERVETPILQPAEALLDLYGEDIRARAFVTHGADDDEAMLRPDFTVPLVSAHMERGVGAARYAYAGAVFRRQPAHPERPVEYHQTGFEIFGGDDPAAADAEVFALFHEVLAPIAPRVTIGDIGILTAATRNLTISPPRRAALLRHIWRPRRFRALLSRFAGAVVPREVPDDAGAPRIGLRSAADVASRHADLVADAAEPPMSPAELAIIDDVLGLRETAAHALARLRDLAVDMPAIGPAVAAFAARLDAIERRGIDAGALPFEGSHGRSSMEYYDGFTFAFQDPARPDRPPMSTGGRYDALTRVLGGGRAVPAVGGVIRPALVLAAGADTC